MKPLWAAPLLSVVLASLTPVAANASTFFSGPLSGTQEVPPNTSPATGSFQATLDGDPTNWTFNYEVTFSGLTGVLRDGHIHFGNFGASGPVVHHLDGLPTGTTSGTITGDWTSAEVSATTSPTAVFNQFLSGQYYFNLHSTTFPGGEIRGQIVQANTSVPEPATLMGLAVASSAALFLRRREQVAK